MPAVLAIVWMGCTSTSDPATDDLAPTTVVVPTADTVQSLELGVTGSCAPTANPLRFACEAEVSQPAPLAWSVAQDGVEVRHFATPSQAVHDLTMWGLAPDTDFTWEVAAGSATASGSFRTGSLPPDLAAYRGTPTGKAATVDHLAITFGCGKTAGVLLMGHDGVIRWYEPLQDRVDLLDGIALWVGADRIVGLGGDRILLLDSTGRVLFDEPGNDIVFHHDAAIVGDHLVALAADRLDDWVVDRLEVFDLTGTHVGQWRLEDHKTPSGTPDPSTFWADLFPGATDFGHGNGLSADGSGHVLLSLRRQDAVLRIAVDPAAADFGAVGWTLASDPIDELTSDFAWPSGGGFEGQHHPSRSSTGGLTLFDNGLRPDDSRALFLSVDETNGTVSEQTSWSMGEYCAHQGGAYETSAGGVLATCSPVGKVLEFVPAEADPVWTMELSCDSLGIPRPANISRARPVTLD